MRKIFHFFLLLLAAPGCVQKFQPTLNSPPAGYLVVEGIINSGGGPAIVTLSRTTVLSDSSMFHESGAKVQVEGNDNSIYPFNEKGNGIYGTDQLLLSSAKGYRLRIKTTDGKEYLSDFSAPKTTPPIDSLNWKLGSDGVRVYVNTHDPMNNTIYYKWDYEETWEIHSHYLIAAYYDTLKDTQGNPIIDVNGNPRLWVIPATSIDYSLSKCWRTVPSTDILAESSIKLSNDVIADFPVSFIPLGSDKLAFKYSILVKQYAIPVDEYNFLQLMKKNTEQTGSIFSSQPSQLQGNIHCVSNPGETVMGYVSFCSVEDKRIFISYSQLANWTVIDTLGCQADSFYNRPDIVLQVFKKGLIPTIPLQVDFYSGNIINFLAAPPSCVDCRLYGTNQQPPFWQ